jgi:hypothetical protein
MIPVPASSRSRASLLEAALVSAAALGLLIVLGRGFGPYWDSWVYFAPAEKFSRWISSWWDGGQVPPMTEWRYYWPDEQKHPPLMEVGAGFFHALFRRELGNLGSCNLIISFFAALWCGAACLFLKHHLGRKLALLGLALAAGSPQFWVHAVILNIDGLIAAVYGMALLVFLFWDRGWRGKAAAYGILTLGFLTKLQAFYLVPILAGWAGWTAYRRSQESPDVRAPREVIRELSLALGVAFLASLTTFVLWPCLWLDFPKGLETYLQFMTHHSNVPVLYFGTLYKGDAIPPWHYPWVFTAIGLPPVLVAPVLVRAGRMIWNAFPKRQQHNSPLPLVILSEAKDLVSVKPTVEVEILRSAPNDRLRDQWPFQPSAVQGECLLWAGMLVPLLVSSLPQAPKYDGIRLLLPAYGPLVLLSALEIGVWWKALQHGFLASLSKGVQTAVLVCAGVLVVLPTARIYPYNLVYYSPLIGGVQGARLLGFELDYLGVSMHRLNPKLNEVAKAGDVLLLAGCNAVVGEAGKEGWPPIPRGMAVIDFKLVREINYESRSVFAIISSRYGDLTPDAQRVLELVPPLDTVTYRGERLFSLHRITKEFVQTLAAEERPRS